MIKSGFSGVLSGRIAKRCPLTSTSSTPHVVSSSSSMVWRASWMSISSAAAKRTLDGEDRAEIIKGEGKGEP